ncbi:MAG: hypothetical protein KKH51_13035 [Actinobacteria bacterium]|nr:hypothetical protein [Actinomycetota bacterium]
MALLLILNGVFNIVVWPTFFRRVLKDPRARDAAGRPTRFLIVHAVIIGIALLLAVASIVVAIIGVW